MAKTARYLVNLWGSEPGTADDCWTGADFDDLADARKAYDHPETVAGDGWQKTLGDPGELWIELVGEGISEHRRIRAGRKAADSGSWHREIANEAGMLHGAEAYNDAMESERPRGPMHPNEHPGTRGGPLRFDPENDS